MGMERPSLSPLPGYVPVPETSNPESKKSAEEFLEALPTYLLVLNIVKVTLNAFP